MSPDGTNRSKSTSKLIRLVCLAAAASSAAVVSDARRAKAEDLVVVYDQSQLLRLPRPASEIIVGNASIADVTVQGGNLLVVTGKTFGVTNIIALDSEKNVIQDQRVLVRRDEKRTVNLHRAGLRQSYSCTPSCSPMLTIGDDTAYFEMVTKHNTTKTSFSDKGGDAGGGQPGQ